MSIQTYPNQKRVVISREMPKQTKDSKRAYMIAYKDNIEAAMKTITKISSLKLYIYLISNVDNYYFALSTQDVSDTCGISLQSAKDAVNDLIEKRYLVLKDKKTYIFYETPHGELDLEPEEEVRKKFRRKSGEIQELTYAELVALGGEEKAKKLWEAAQ